MLAGLACAIENGDPGAFVRALWGWMFAIDDKLRDEQPAVARSVLSGEPVEAPAAVRLLLGATTSLRVWLRGQRDHVSVATPLGRSDWRTRRSGFWTPTPEVVRLPRAVVCAPPYVAILAAATDDPVAPYMDTTGWLADRSGDRRQVTLYLPTISALADNASPTPVTYEQLVA